MNENKGIPGFIRYKVEKKTVAMAEVNALPIERRPPVAAVEPKIILRFTEKEIIDMFVHMMTVNGRPFNVINDSYGNFWKKMKTSPPDFSLSNENLRYAIRQKSEAFRE